MRSEGPADAPLSASELQLWHAVKTIGDEALRFVSGELGGETGLSGPDFGVLSRLEDIGSGRLGQKALLDSLNWDKSRLSHQLTRMEARDLVRRQAPDSGRGVIVAILPAGRAAIARARPVHAAAVRSRVLAHIDADAARAILELARHFQQPT